MRRVPSGALAALVAALVAPAGAQPAKPPADGERLFDAFELKSRREPITVTSDNLEYDYKKNVVVYRGGVQAAQGPVHLRADELTVTFGRRDGGAAKPEGDDALPGGQRVDEIVAVGNVRIDHGARWATGGRAVFDQGARTLVLSESPVLHDGSNEVAGDRVVVYLDQDRSVVEGGRRRVKAVLYPGAADQAGKTGARKEPAGNTGP